jgi:hypothetical protein
MTRSLIRMIWLTVLLSLASCPGSGPTKADGSPPPPPTAEVPVVDVPALPTPAPERRSLAELQQAACRAGDGSWRCKNVKPTLAAGATPIIPLTWSIPAWFTDEQNLSTTASDGNDCITAATACLTFSEISVHRWGTISPKLQTVVIITNLSNWSATAGVDAVSYQGRTPLTGAILFVGNLGAPQTIVSGVLAGVVAKATPNTLLQATLAAPTAVGQLIHNTTHDSYAFVLTALGGGNFEITQPVVQNAPFFLVGAEVNTWANGDSYTVFAPPQINLDNVTTMTGNTPNMAFQKILPAGSGPFILNLNGCSISAGVPMSFEIGGTTPSVLANVFNAGIAISKPSTGVVAVNVAAGAVVSPGFMQGSFSLAKDFIVTSSLTAFGGQVTNTIWGRGPVTATDGTLSFAAAALFAGNNTLTLTKSGRVQWPAAQTAVNTFVTTAATPFLLNGAVTACSLVLGTGVTACGIAVTPTSLDAVAGVAGFGGNAIGPFGTRVTNATN